MALQVNEHPFWNNLYTEVIQKLLSLKLPNRTTFIMENTLGTFKIMSLGFNKMILAILPVLFNQCLKFVQKKSVENYFQYSVHNLDHFESKNLVIPLIWFHSVHLWPTTRMNLGKHTFETTLIFLIFRIVSLKF